MILIKQRLIRSRLLVCPTWISQRGGVLLNLCLGVVFIGSIFFPKPWPHKFFFFFYCEIPRSFQILHFFIVVVTFINFERITYFVGKILFCLSKGHFKNLGKKQFTSLCLILRNVWERICQEFHIAELKLCAFLCVYGNLVKCYDFCSQKFPPQ